MLLGFPYLKWFALVAQDWAPQQMAAHTSHPHTTTSMNINHFDVTALADSLLPCSSAECSCFISNNAAVLASTGTLAHVWLLWCRGHAQHRSPLAGEGVREAMSDLISGHQVEGSSTATKSSATPYPVQIRLKCRPPGIPLCGHIKVDHQRDLHQAGITYETCKLAVISGCHSCHCTPMGIPWASLPDDHTLAGSKMSRSRTPLPPLCGPTDNPASAEPPRIFKQRIQANSA